MTGFYSRYGKRILDFCLALLGLLLTFWIGLLAFIAASIDTRSFGLFMQERIGQYGQLFTIYKIKTMRPVIGIETAVTTSSDVRITRLGKILRVLKIDELPQLVNVLFGQMSFVGPRPDVPGFADKLLGDDRIILNLRPGITGPATLEFRNEEEILAQAESPEDYNRDVIFRRKIELNRDYAKSHSLIGDLAYIFKTIFPNK